MLFENVPVATIGGPRDSIIKVRYNGPGRVINVRGLPELRCTDNHEILTTDGFVPAKMITNNSIVATLDGDGMLSLLRQNVIQEIAADAFGSEIPVPGIASTFTNQYDRAFFIGKGFQVGTPDGSMQVTNGLSVDNLMANFSGMIAFKPVITASPRHFDGFAYEIGVSGPFRMYVASGIVCTRKWHAERSRSDVSRQGEPAMAGVRQ